MDFAFLPRWSDFLPQSGGHVLAFSGSGGKTGLMREVAGFYGDLGLEVILTTTTASEPIPACPALAWSDLADEHPLPPAVFVHAGCGTEGKFAGLQPGQVDALRDRWPQRIVLCEVDGAAKRPLKLYRPAEPCWPDATSLALVLMGAGAVGMAAGDSIHRLGRPLATPAEVAGMSAQDQVQWSVLQTLLLAEGGYLAHVPDQVPVVLVLSGLDDQQDSLGLFEFAGRVMADPRLPLLLFRGCGPQGTTLRTAYRRSDAPSDQP